MLKESFGVEGFSLESPPCGGIPNWRWMVDIASILEWVFDAIYQTTSIFQFIVMFLLQSSIRKHVEASSIQLPRSTNYTKIARMTLLVRREHGSRAAWI